MTTAQVCNFIVRLPTMCDACHQRHFRKVTVCESLLYSHLLSKKIFFGLDFLGATNSTRALECFWCQDGPTQVELSVLASLT
ncbi:hypothetical protein L210DRAFT_3546733 [Boletus edulis BED1]|uniref:Uncharacterized protein n=1 Tax=Boletus edulis BED1 TaxID=1328754 RepID=A0AAD4BQS8_BOLED|nr:hypothetical protein L210DRAFT_3546733 [Boletus edulis BED1]